MRDRYERELALMSAKEKRNYEKPYIVEKAGKLRNDTIRYQYLVPFESWMKDARLDMQRDECGCGETALMNIEEFGKVTLERVWTPYVGSSVCLSATESGRNQTTGYSSRMFSGFRGE